MSAVSRRVGCHYLHTCGQRSNTSASMQASEGEQEQIRLCAVELYESVSSHSILDTDFTLIQSRTDAANGVQLGSLVYCHVSLTGSASPCGRASAPRRAPMC